MTITEPLETAGATLTPAATRVARTPAELLAQMNEPLDPDRYDWQLATVCPPTPDEVFQLSYAAQVEWATEGTFESLDVSKDPLVREFLQVWLAQEVVHGELLARFLDEGGVTVEPLHTSVRQRRAARRGALLNTAAHRVIGDDFIGVHMMWGALNELTTLRFYRLVRQRSENPLLRILLRDLIAQESMHYSFYLESATHMLDGNPRGQRIVRFVLEHLWSPVGVGLRTRVDADRLMLGLFDDEPSQVAQIDAAMQRVPGMAGLDLVARSMDRARRGRVTRSPGPRATLVV